METPIAKIKEKFYRGKMSIVACREALLWRGVPAKAIHEFMLSVMRYQQ